MRVSRKGSSGSEPSSGASSPKFVLPSQRLSTSPPCGVGESSSFQSRLTTLSVQKNSGCSSAHKCNFMLIKGL